MKALVVYEFRFGNTERIARAVAAALESHGTVQVAAVATAPVALAGIDLLVVGGPTQVHGISPAMRTFLDALAPDAVQDLPIAVFDTRLPGSRLLTGSAADGIARRLVKKGGWLMVPACSFQVLGMEGPLADGEAARAGTWAAEVAEAVRLRLPAVTVAAG